MAVNEYLDSFFSTTYDAEETTIGGVTVVGIFRREYVETELIEGVRPTLLVKTADLPGGTGHGTAVVRGGGSYTIIGLQPDEVGATTLLILREANV